MKLHDHLTDTLDRIDQTGPDLDRLTTTARIRGGALRRRRATGLSVAAGVAALALTGGLFAGLSGSEGSVPLASDPGRTGAPVVTPDLDGPRAATTGQSAVLALRWALDQQRPGAATELAGQLFATGGDYYVELHWADADGLGSSLVGLNVQHGRGMHVDSCAEITAWCRVSTLSDGSQQTEYDETDPVPDGVGRRRVVDLLRPDHLRIVATSTNGFEQAGGVWDLTRTSPPLTFGDLEAITRQPIWGDTLPVAFVEAGEHMTDYRDINDHGGWIGGNS
ncbi:MAG: hypothetical protein JWO76_354 [Nocardioides sp.]|nr:hypothetical protein [Nocardioides sp.]